MFWTLQQNVYLDLFRQKPSPVFNTYIPIIMRNRLTCSCFRFILMIVAVFLTLTERCTCETFDEDCSNIRPLDIYPPFDNFSCFEIEDMIDPTSSFDRIVFAHERSQIAIEASSSQEFLDIVSETWVRLQTRETEDENVIAFHIVRFKGNRWVFNRRKVVAIHRVHEGTYLCSGSFIRVHANLGGTMCVENSYGEGVRGAKGRYWLKPEFCDTGSMAWLGNRPVEKEGYTVYPEVIQCPRLEILFPKNGVISALPGEEVVLLLEFDVDINDYTLTCEDGNFPNATISEDGLVLWNVPSHLNANFQALKTCQIETTEGDRRSVNIAFEIFHCDCSYQGNCRLARNATRGSGDYVCECDSGYEGSRCEIDIDECASNPCYPGVLCVNFNAMYWCMECPSGMEGDGINCTEIHSATEKSISTSSTPSTNPSPVEGLTTTTESKDLCTHPNTTKTSHVSLATSIPSTTNTQAVTDDALKTFLSSRRAWTVSLFAIGTIEIMFSTQLINIFE